MADYSVVTQRVTPALAASPTSAVAAIVSHLRRGVARVSRSVTTGAPEGGDSGRARMVA